MGSRENTLQNRSGMGARGDAESIRNDPPWKNAGCGSPNPPSAASLKHLSCLCDKPPSPVRCAGPWHLISHRLRNVPVLKPSSKSVFGLLMSPQERLCVSGAQAGLGFIFMHQCKSPQE